MDRPTQVFDGKPLFFHRVIPSARRGVYRHHGKICRAVAGRVSRGGANGERAGRVRRGVERITVCDLCAFGDRCCPVSLDATTRSSTAQSGDGSDRRELTVHGQLDRSHHVVFMLFFLVTGIAYGVSAKTIQIVIEMGGPK